jgi:hypothetical protein
MLPPADWETTRRIGWVGQLACAMVATGRASATEAAIQDS